MKKRTFTLLLVLAMLFTLAACGTTPAPAPATAAPAAPVETAAPVDDMHVTLADGTVYPSETITLYCPWAAGGSSDLMCRKIGEMAESYLGVSVNVVNVEGGNGSVALGEVANTVEPDGYTISLFSAGNFTTMPYVQDVTYTFDSFDFIAGVSSEPLAVIVKSESPWTNLQDIVDDYKANGEPILHGQSGSNGTNHMNSIRMFTNMGVEQAVVPYSGASGALAGLLGDEVPCIIIHPGQVLGNIESGEVRVIAMIYFKQVDMFPGVETVEEQGFGDVSSETYKGLVCPAGTDDAIVEWLGGRFGELFASEEWTSFLGSNGIEVSGLTGQEILTRMQTEISTLWVLMEELSILKEGAVKPTF